MFNISAKLKFTTEMVLGYKSRPWDSPYRWQNDTYLYTLCSMFPVLNPAPTLVLPHQFWLSRQQMIFLYFLPRDEAFSYNCSPTF
jgi:hypothetical protein